jgi:hypothetical protein
MKAYLTFARRKEDDIHMLGLDNPINIYDLLFTDLKSGQPILTILNNHKIIGFYIIDIEGNLYQLIGETDYLFDMYELVDLTIINLQKYNLIKYYVSNLFDCLSIQEAKYNDAQFEFLEEKIFYNLLHIETDIYKLKSLINKEIKKSELSEIIKNRLLIRLKLIKTPNKKILKKKVDIDLSGYSIKIDALVQ